MHIRVIKYQLRLSECGGQVTIQDESWQILMQHYNDVTMSVMGSQITSIWTVCLAVCSGAHQRKHQISTSLAFVRENPPVTGGLPLQRASNAENVFIWWHHLKLASYIWVNSSLYIFSGKLLCRMCFLNPHVELNDWIQVNQYTR